MALVCATVVVGGSTPRAGAQAEPRVEHVILIGFDGYDPDYVGRAPTPHIDALAERGVRGVTEGVMLSITNPSFTAIATGAWPDRNGNLAYWWDKVANTYRGQARANDITGIAHAVRDHGGTVGSAQYFILQANGTDYGDPEGLYTQPSGSCERIFDDAIAMLNEEPVQSGTGMVTVRQTPTLQAVYCGQLDAIGHEEGAESPNIDLALVELDAQVGRLVAELDELGIADSTAIILTGDHGMTTYTQTFGVPLYQALVAAGYSAQPLLVTGIPVNPTVDVVMVPAGRSASLYLAGDLEGDEAALADLREVVAGVEGTSTIYDKEDQAAMHMHPGYGDLVVESQPGWSADILPTDRPKGAHGSGAESDAVFVMAGAGVGQSADEVRVRHIDVAPTIAELLGLPPLPHADGEVLADLLEQDEPPPSTSTSTTSTSTTSVPPSTTTPPSTTPSVVGSRDDLYDPLPAARLRPSPADAAEPMRARPRYVG